MISKIKSLSLSLATLSLLAGACQKDVQPRPTADFTYSVISSSNVEKVFLFSNASKNADRFQWSTPTGLAQSTTDFKLSVTQNQRVSVSLTAKNDAGEDTKTESIDVTDLATTGDFIFWSQIGNYGDISIYVNGTYQGKLTKYINNGVAPSCGSQGFVTVTLAPGTYSFSAKSEGLFSLKWDSSFTVVRGQCNSTQLTK